MTYLLIFAIAGQLADVWTTRRFLRAGTPEGNPLMAPLLDKIGLPAVAAIKVALVVGVVVTSYPFIWPSVVAIAVGFGAAAYNEWKWRERVR